MKNRIVLNLLVAGVLASGFLLSGCAPITVGSTTEGASVYYKKSDKLIGEAPVRVTLYANSREVIVRKDGYFSKTVLLSPVGPENISVELKKRDKVLILSHPPGAELYVKGNRVGRTPYRLDYDKPYRSFEVRSPGYAPFEQYHSKSNKQGPWSDIYGMGATLYRAISGKQPMDAVDRSEGLLKQSTDPYVTAREAAKGRYSGRFLDAIDHALCFNEALGNVANLGLACGVLDDGFAFRQSRRHQRIMRGANRNFWKCDTSAL